MLPYAFLFILDFSGSMDQVVDDQAKLATLKKQTAALASTMDASAPLQLKIIGSNTKKGCQDVQSIATTAGRFKSEVSPLRAGEFGKTPLGLAIRGLKEDLRKHAVEKILIVTDGADTCGLDPCAELEKVDKAIPKRDEKIDFFVIGYDLRNRDKSLTCFKNLKLENFNIQFASTRTPWDMQKLLRKAQGLNDSSSARGTNRSGAPSAQDPDQRPSANQVDQNENKSLKGQAALEILGAPPEAEFSLKSPKITKKWQGAFLVKVEPGQYDVAYDSPEGKSVSLSLPPDSHTRIPFSALLLKPTGTFSTPSQFLEFELQPMEKTLAMTPSAQKTSIKATLDLNQTTPSQLPLGDWMIRVKSPPWLADALPNVKISIRPGQDNPYTLDQLFADKLTWLENDRPEKQRVLRVKTREKSKSAGDEEQTYLIQQGTVRVPVLSESKSEWAH